PQSAIFTAVLSRPQTSAGRVATVPPSQLTLPVAATCLGAGNARLFAPTPQFQQPHCRSPPNLSAPESAPVRVPQELTSGRLPCRAHPSHVALRWVRVSSLLVRGLCPGVQREFLAAVEPPVPHHQAAYGKLAR